MNARHHYAAIQHIKQDRGGPIILPFFECTACFWEDGEGEDVRKELRGRRGREVLIYKHQSYYLRPATQCEYIYPSLMLPARSRVRVRFWMAESWKGGQLGLS